MQLIFRLEVVKNEFQCVKPKKILEHREDKSFLAFQGGRKLVKLFIEIAFHGISAAEMKCYRKKIQHFMYKPAEDISKCMSHTKCVVAVITGYSNNVQAVTSQCMESII